MSGKRQEQKQGGALGALRILYRIIVVISLVIIVGYCAAKLLIHAPAQRQLTPNDTTEQDAGQKTDVEPSRSEDEQPQQTDEPEVKLERKDRYYTFLLAAQDQSSGNADTIMLMSYDIKEKTIGIVSVPRDTLVGGKYVKINSYYHDGPEALRDKLSYVFGIPIDYYITVDTTGFCKLVDKVGGIDFYIPCKMDYDDPLQDLHIHFTKGTRHLNGADALKVVRFRKNNDGSGYSDVGRTETQQKLLIALAKKVLSWSGMKKFNEFIEIFGKYVKTDLSGTDLTYFAGQAVYLDLSKDVTSRTLPGDGSVTYKGTRWCYQLEEKETLEIIDQLLDPYTTEMTAKMLHITKGSK